MQEATENSEEKSDSTHDVDRRQPLYLLPFSSESSLEAAYSSRCRAVRRALQQDVTKLLQDGRSVLIEGSLLDPTLFEDLLPTDDESVRTRRTRHAQAEETSDLAASAAAGAAASVSPPVAVAPILLSFHVTLPAAKQQLLLHNHFASLIAAAAASPVLPGFAPPSAIGGTTTSPSASILPFAAPTPLAVPPSPALIWRNLRWLESIVTRRHQQWTEIMQRRNNAHRDTSTVGASLLSPHTISLDPLHSAVDSMHATVLDAMQARAHQCMTTATEPHV
jgi:hypothetical protein